MIRDLMFHAEARAKLVRGAKILARAVGTTLGPGGRCVLIESQFGRVIATRDGVTVAREIVLEDPIENMGARLLADAALKVAKVCGDGTTTTVAIAADLLERGTALVLTGGSPPTEIVAQIESGALRAIDALYAHSLAFTTLNANDQRMLARLVVSVACKGDRRVIEPVMEAMEHVGTAGSVLLREGELPSVTVKKEVGYRLDRGWIDPLVGPQDGTQRLVLEDCWVLVTTRPLDDARNLLPVLQHAAGQSLLVVAPTLSEEPLRTLHGNTRSGALKATAIRAPGFGDAQWFQLHDLAVFTGGRVSDLPGAFEADALGFAKRVEVTTERAFVTDGSGDPAIIRQRITRLEQERRDARNEYDKDKLGDRLGRLRGRIAEVHAGAPTPAEAIEVKHRVEDSLCALRVAIESGLQPGGGIALLRAARAIPDDTPGGRALRAAMEAPARLIARNYGTEPHHVMQSIDAPPPPHLSWYWGADATGKARNMMEYPDPTAVVVEALRAAVSTVVTLLLAEATVTIPNSELDKQ